MIEREHQLRHFRRRLRGHAMAIVAPADLIHRIRQRLQRPRHLPRNIQRQPAAGKEHQRRQHQQQQKIRHPDDPPLPIQRPVLARADAQLRHRRIQTGRHRQPRDNHPPARQARCSQRVLRAAHHQHRFIRPLCRFQDRPRQWLPRFNSLRSLVRHPRTHFRGSRRLGQLVRGDRGRVPIQDRESPLQGDVVRPHLLKNRLAIIRSRARRQRRRPGHALGLRPRIQRRITRQFHSNLR